MVAKRIAAFENKEFLKNAINIDKFTGLFDKLDVPSYFYRLWNTDNLLI